MELKTLPKGKDTDYLLLQVQEHRDRILNGTMLVIDPASISMGFALYRGGKLVKSGKISTSNRKHKRTIPAEIRLKALMKKMDFRKTDLLAIERIRGKMAPYALYWSVGAVITNHKYDDLIEVPIFSWKEFVAHDYFKDDEQDALTMGTTLIEIAERLEEYNDVAF